ncbi:CIS tube protein [Paludibacterium purpuratum]|uniref:Contractile injection system tube protein N-terminal domain-containing protein n=1 Tax=Paludibacterium purpuratum TaxID=1144873 RepID=A0A4R7BES6_9NEIS|nr:peptidoglycan-binding protein [Paludibacterium purpuratum]TDR82772.1 hypothetical protein DFP86_101161 [Paludibacterium purpuratum]
MAILDALQAERAALKIVACEEHNGMVMPSAPFISLQVNPSQVARAFTTCFTKSKPMGDAGAGRQFSHMQPGTLSFSTVFDGTGVIPRPLFSLLPINVEDQIESLKLVVYDYKGTAHQPNIVQIVWGSQSFTGRLTRLNITYTLFRPSGSPLRATVELAFDEYISRKQRSLEISASSPDLSHMVEVRDGDTLPLLCQRIYGDSRYYAEVARFNGLQRFRSLPPGLQLHFPPLE